jgi:phage baseplate assembly protein W
MTTINEERDAVRARLLGFGLECVPIESGDHGRDLVPAKDAQGRMVDLARVTDVDCLAQSLEIALTTALGSDVFNTGFGFDGLRAFSGGSAPSLARETARIAVIDVLRKEPRVARIVDVEVGDGRALRDPSTGFGRLDVTIAFETVSGDSIALTLGGGGSGV